jgi:hypothetical protein
MGSGQTVAKMGEPHESDSLGSQASPLGALQLGLLSSHPSPREEDGCFTGSVGERTSHATQPSPSGPFSFCVFHSVPSLPRVNWTDSV